MNSDTSDLLNAYKTIHNWLNDNQLDFPTAVLLSRLHDDLASAYLAWTGEKIGQALGWDSEQ